MFLLVLNAKAAQQLAMQCSGNLLCKLAMLSIHYNSLPHLLSLLFYQTVKRDNYNYMSSMCFQKHMTPVVRSMFDIMSTEFARLSQAFATINILTNFTFLQLYKICCNMNVIAVD